MLKATKAYYYVEVRIYGKILSKTLLKMAGGGCIRSIPHIPPGSAPGCIITKDALKFKRDVLNQTYRRQLRHDCCKEVKGMLFGESGKTYSNVSNLVIFYSSSSSNIYFSSVKNDQAHNKQGRKQEK